MPLMARQQCQLLATEVIFKGQHFTDKVNKEISLQIAIKAINDLARPNKIISTFLVFGAYP
jgi:hypothetical protein